MQFVCRSKTLSYSHQHLVQAIGGDMKDFDTAGRFVHLLEIGATHVQAGCALRGLLGRKGEQSAPLKGSKGGALSSPPVPS
jgi:hypothetical protein